MPHGYPMIRRQGTTGGLICRSIERFDCADGRFPFKRVPCFLSDKSRILFIARQRPTAERKDSPYTRLCPNPRRVPRFSNPPSGASTRPAGEDRQNNGNKSEALQKDFVLYILYTVGKYGAKGQGSGRAKTGGIPNEHRFIRLILFLTAPFLSGNGIPYGGCKTRGLSHF